MENNSKKLTILERWANAPIKPVPTGKKVTPPTEEQIKSAKEWIREHVKKDFGEDVIFDDEEES